ncbi:MAG: AbfB domain-containing protein [Saprospiraceae bacterium]|nr:AbfB domain-containing protein [Saprospiraceae bacterium]
MKTIISAIVFTICYFIGTAQVASFQSVNYPDKYIRHSNSTGYITNIVSELDKLDATFKIVKGLDARCPDCISLESINYPGRFLRHSYSKIILTSINNDLDRADASFRRVSGLAGKGNSYQSFNYPNRYIRHAYSVLYIADKTEDDLFKNDATFNEVRVNGREAKFVKFMNANGESCAFRQESNGKWSELNGNRVVFNFNEVNRDDWSVYLQDPSRGIALQLDLHTFKVMISSLDGSNRRFLYNILWSLR